ncbi:arsenite methyltransferase [Nitrospira sp. Nam80]
MKTADDIKEIIRADYAQAARQAKTGKASCCGSGSLLEQGKLDPITADLYKADETAGLPAEALQASFGCGNPTALATIEPGETVLDLGSGGGIDVLLSARRVGPTGKVYGLDMTDDMLTLARENQEKAEISNVEFLKGDIEDIPLPDNSVDLIISNCVINLSPNKDLVLREAFRVLKPGGRFAVSDIVVRGRISSEIRHNVELWAGCVAGALEESVYLVKLKEAGFEQVSIEPTRVYTADDAREFIIGAGLNVDMVGHDIDGKFMSGFIRAIKPKDEVRCCSPSCCS